jgi:hypothetical protein
MALHHLRYTADSTLTTRPDVIKSCHRNIGADSQYRISVGDVSFSKELAVRSGSNSICGGGDVLARSERDNCTRRATCSCGMNPGPLWLRTIILLLSFIGDWLDRVRKRLVGVLLSMFSDFARQRLTEATVCGGATCVALTRPRNGSLGDAGFFEKTAPSST